MVKKVLLSLLNAVLVFAIVLGIAYVRMVIVGGGTFVPNWFEYVFLAVVAGVATFFGPDREQRKRNREDLKNKFTHDNDTHEE